jgi:Ca2+-binding RTX toxin-like protein
MATFTGTTSAETLTGGTGSDALYGGAGNDTVFGGAGDDTIYGGADSVAPPNYVSVNGASQSVTGTGGRANFSASTSSGDGDLTAYNFYGVNGVWIGNGDSTEGHTHSFSSQVAGARIPFNAVNTSDVFSITLDGVAVNLTTAIANGSVTFDGAGAYGLNASGGIAGLAGGNALATGTITINTPFSKIGFSNTGSGNGTVYDLQVNTNPIGGVAAGGDDALFGGDGNDLIYTETGNDTVDGGAGNDTVDGGTGRDSIAGGDGIDRLSGGADADTLAGGAGKDLLFGGDGTDLLYGGDGDDSADGGAGAARLYGDVGSDTLLGGGGADSLFGGGDNDRLFGGSENDVLSGDAGNDLLDGGSGNDTLDGGAGDDTVAGGSGADSLIGGLGTDTLDYSASGAGVSVNLVSGTGQGGDAAGDVVSGFEAVTGSAHADSLTAAANGSTLLGGGGADNLFGGAGRDVIDGGSDADFLWGDAGDDVLEGGDGADTLHAGADSDQTFGGSGDDLLYSSQGDDLLDGGKGSDTFLVTTESGYERIVGGDEGDDTDTLAFASKSQGVEVTFKADETGYFQQSAVEGSESKVNYQGDFAEIERVTGTDFDDQIDGSATEKGLTVEGAAGNDLLIGGHGADQLYGGDDQDSLFGGDGEDYLQGGSGDDSLRGGSGIDKLEGGKGFDRFQLEIADSGDVILDFDISIDKEGPTTDQLDVSELTDREGNPVKTWDIKVEDAGENGTILHFPSGESVTLLGVSAKEVEMPGMLHCMGVPCFAQGTRIMTPVGEQEVENILAGDLVLTAAGHAVPVLWHGQRHLDTAALAARPELRPVRLRSASHGNRRELVLSPQHGVVVGGSTGPVLVRAGHLAQLGWGARMAKGLRAVTYHHLLVPAHAVLLAEGAPVESFYPGPIALAALQAADRRALVMAIQRQHPSAKPDALAQSYGPRCLQLLSFKQAHNLHQSRLRSGPRSEGFHCLGSFPIPWQEFREA